MILNKTQHIAQCWLRSVVLPDTVFFSTQKMDTADVKISIKHEKSIAMSSPSRKSARRLVYRTLLLHGRNHEDAFAIIRAYFDSVYSRYKEYRQSPTELTKVILRLHQTAIDKSIPDSAAERRQISKIINAVYEDIKDRLDGVSIYSVVIPTKAGPVDVKIKPISHEHALATYEVEHPRFGIWHGCVSSLTKKPMSPHHIDEFFDILREAERTNNRHTAKYEKRHSPPAPTSNKG